MTSHIYILNEKANNFNKYALSLYCRIALGHEVAYENKFLNKKDRIKSHLKKCENFKLAVGEQNINQILEEEESTVINSQRALQLNQVLLIYYE